MATHNWWRRQHAIASMHVDLVVDGGHAKWVDGPAYLKVVLKVRSLHVTTLGLSGGAQVTSDGPKGAILDICSVGRPTCGT